MGAHPPVPLFEQGDHHPGLPVQGNCPRCQCDIVESHQPTQPYNIQSLKELRADLIHPPGLATEELFNHLGDLVPRDWRAQPRVPRLSFFNRRHVGGIEEVFEVLCPPAHNVPSRGQQHTISTINSVGAALLPPPEMPDGGPESLRSRTEVFLHGLSKLLPRPSFCLSNHPSRMPLRLPVPISCFRSPTGQKGLVGLFLQPDGIPHRRCPPTGTRVAAATGTDNLAATVPTGRLDNGGTEHSPLRLHVPHLPPGRVPKFCRRWELKLRLTGDSARRSQQTLTTHLGLPGLTGFLPHHHQVVVSGQLRTSLHPSVQDIGPQIQ
uniref:Uncharacterized protein n=1 Tax=Xiphophorus maculatus TaxID=8083 RepID=Q9PTQ6_XIPMA|nr:unknown [Xiphophorus maculatus]